MADYTVGISSSFVKKKFKIKGDSGKGESTIYMGSLSKKAEFDSYFDFSGPTTYKLDKDNLLDYLQKVKIEYIYQSINKYENISLADWQDAYDYVATATSLTFDLKNQPDAKRYYINAVNTKTNPNSEEIYLKCLRMLPIPQITELKMTKKNNEITFKLDIKKPDAAPSLKYESKYDRENYKLNMITFGAPGTGKSYWLKKQCELLTVTHKGSYERVTFYADYSHAQFVGTYKPVTNGDGEIEYRFVPGPFLRIYVEALKSARTKKPSPHVLLIEKINRAKVATVFGEMFQLLDRDEKGISEYSIATSEDVKAFLAEELSVDAKECEIMKLPDNMFIWATMNSADQGVFPMDTAFKRRWDFNYIGIDDEEITEDSKGVKKENIKLKFILNNQEIRWNVLRRAINAKLSSNKDGIRANEDKLMGPFFVKCDQYKLNATDVIASKAENDEFVSVLNEKVLMYLFEDVARTRRDELFEGMNGKGNCNKYSDIKRVFMSEGLELFGHDFKTKYYDAEEKSYDDKKVREGV